MTEGEVFEALQPMVAEVLGLDREEVKMASCLVEELGAESIDLLDLSFLIEQKFGITIEANEFEKAAIRRMPGADYERDGYLTPQALEQLKNALPEIPRDKFVPKLRKVDIPSLLTVAVFVHLIQRKLDEQ